MGPPPFGDGNSDRKASLGNCWRRFNGATAFRRWKRPSVAGMLISVSRFNGATAFRRWKRDNLPDNDDNSRASMGPPPFGDGNNATEAGGKMTTVASMGPPPFGDGNVIKCLVLSSSRLCFNGATAFRRWKPGRPGRGGPALLCFNGATAFRRWKLARDIEGFFADGLASMGPPPFGDGNQMLWRWNLNYVLLQWGHRLSAMETSAVQGLLQSIKPSFNGATAFRRWKRSISNQI